MPRYSNRMRLIKAVERCQRVAEAVLGPGGKANVTFSIDCSAENVDAYYRERDRRLELRTAARIKRRAMMRDSEKEPEQKEPVEGVDFKWITSKKTGERVKGPVDWFGDTF